MTTMVLNYSQSLLEGLWSGLKKTLQGIMIGYLIARQTEANRLVAQQLVNAGEYRQSDYWSLLNDLNSRTIQSIHREFKDD
jgi:hypothetical protein